MRKGRCVLTAVVLGAVLLSAHPAAAWGPRTNLALVTTASNIVSREGRVPLARLEGDIVNGASLSLTEISVLYPNVEQDIVGTIEAEMHLLQAVRGDRLDPYFAFRLGMLGKLVARESAPMAERKPAYRNLYYADVDAGIDNVLFQPARRRKVEPKDYFARVAYEASLRDDIYERDYRSGIGFDGAAKASLSEEASRSVTAIIDVWTTVLTNRVLHANLSESGVRDYVVATFQYYIDQGKEGYIDSSYERLLDLTDETPDLRLKLGDMFYKALQYERAMTEYEAALALAPGRKDVAEKISAYYVREGDTELKAENYEAALEAYAKALEAEPLHPTAESKRLETEKLMEEREARLEASRQALEVASAAWREADQAALNSDFAEAISLLNEARVHYEEVTPEFAPLYKEAESALKRLMYRSREFEEASLSAAHRV